MLCLRYYQLIFLSFAFFAFLVSFSGKRQTYTGTSPPLFSKKAMQWGKKWPVQMNLPFFAVEAYVPGGGPESGRKKFEKMPSGRYRYKDLLFQFLCFGGVLSFFQRNFLDFRSIWGAWREENVCCFGGLLASCKKARKKKIKFHSFLTDAI